MNDRFISKNQFPRMNQTDQQWVKEISDKSLQSSYKFYDQKVQYNRFLLSLKQEQQLKPNKMRILIKNKDQTEMMSAQYNQFYQQSDRINNDANLVDEVKRQGLCKKHSNLATKRVDQLPEIQQQNMQAYSETEIINDIALHEYNNDGQIETIPIAETQEEDEENIEQNDLEFFEQENEDYFRHLRGECLCVNPEVNFKCKFKDLKLKSNQLVNSLSTYDIKHNKKEKQGITVIDTGKLHEALKYEGPQITTETIAQRDWVPLPIPKKKRKIVPKIDDPMYCGATVYGSAFLNWGATIPDSIKWSQSLVRTTNDKQRFSNQVSYYKKEFEKLKYIEPTKPINKNWVTSTVKSPIPFESETTVMQHFKGQSSEDILKYQITTGQLDNKDYGYYQGTFKTTDQMKNEHTNRSIPRQRTQENDIFKGKFQQSIYKPMKQIQRQIRKF